MAYKSLEEAKADQDKIGMTEAYLVIAFALLADAFEIAAAASIGAVVGLLLFPIAALFGYMISGGLVFWSLFRGKRGRFVVKRVLITSLGGLADGFLLSVFPIRTGVIIVVILLNNYSENKLLKKAMNIAGIKL